MPGRGPRPTAPVASLVIAVLPPAPVAPRANPSASPDVPRAASAAAARVAPVGPVASRPTPPAPSVARVQPNEPEVLFAQDETVALQRLMRGITRGAVDPATLSQAGAIAAIQPGPIVLAPLPGISPVTIEPFGSLAEGVRQ
jgi:hypothetical protein